MIPSIPLSTRVRCERRLVHRPDEDGDPEPVARVDARRVTTAQFRVAARAPGGASQRGRRRGRTARSTASAGRTAGREHAAAGHAEAVLG